MEHARAAVAAVPMSRRMLWRRADTIAAGYPSHLQQYVRLLALLGEKNRCHLCPVSFLSSFYHFLSILESFSLRIDLEI